MYLCGTVFCWYPWRRYERSICQSTWGRWESGNSAGHYQGKWMSGRNGISGIYLWRCRGSRDTWIYQTGRSGSCVSFFTGWNSGWCRGIWNLCHCPGGWLQGQRLSGSAYGRRGISGWSERPILYREGEWNHYPALQCEWDSFQCDGFCTEAEYEYTIPSYGVVKGWTSCSRNPLLWFLHIL